jgi:hypothetical protein
LGHWKRSLERCDMAQVIIRESETRDAHAYHSDSLLFKELRNIYVRFLHCPRMFFSKLNFIGRRQKRTLALNYDSWFLFSFTSSSSESWRCPNQIWPEKRTKKTPMGPAPSFFLRVDYSTGPDSAFLHSRTGQTCLPSGISRVTSIGSGISSCKCSSFPNSPFWSLLT